MDMKPLISVLSQVTLLMIVAAVGMRAHWSDVTAAIRHSGWLGRGVGAVNLGVPAVAVGLCTLLPMEEPIKIGIVIMAVSPLAPLLTGKMAKAGVDMSVAVGLYVALILLAVFIVPATIALLSASFPPDASISVAAVAQTMLKSVLAPLAAGLMIGTAAPKLAQPLADILTKVGYIGLAILAIPIIYAQGGDIIALVGDGAVLTIAITVFAGIAAGHYLGGPDPHNRCALALAAATRHPGIAALIAQQNFTDRRVMLAIMLFLATSVVVSTIYQGWLKKRLPAAVQPVTA